MFGQIEARGLSVQNGGVVTSGNFDLNSDMKRVYAAARVDWSLCNFKVSLPTNFDLANSPKLRSYLNPDASVTGAAVKIVHRVLKTGSSIVV